MWRQPDEGQKMFMMAFKLTDTQKVHNVYRSLKAQIKAHYRSIFFVTDFCQDLCKVSKILESEGLKEKKSKYVSVLNSSK